MDEILKIGEVAHSNSFNCDVICVKDDFNNKRYGCQSCIFYCDESCVCLSDMFTDKFECRRNHRPDKTDVHYEKYEQDK